MPVVPIRLFILLATFVLAACDGVSAPEHYQSAERYFEQGEYKTAVVELKNALQKDPELGRARLLLAKAYEIQGQYSDASREFERAQNLGVVGPELEAGLFNAKLHIGRHQEVIGELGDRASLTTCAWSILKVGHANY